MDQDQIETLLPRSFKKIQECVNRLLRNHNEEEKKEEEKLENNKI